MTLDEVTLDGISSTKLNWSKATFEQFNLINKTF